MATRAASSRLVQVGGETHFDIAITATAFEGLSRVAHQRLVYSVVAQELAGPVHALSLTTKAPGEG